MPGAEKPSGWATAVPVRHEAPVRHAATLILAPGLTPFLSGRDPPDRLGAYSHTDGKDVWPEAAASASVSAKLSLGSARRPALARSDS